MDLFHIILDTSFMRATPFGHPKFGQLLWRVQQGVAKVYVPFIALEERRTQLLADYDGVMMEIQTNISRLKNGQLGMMLGGLEDVAFSAPSRSDVDRNSTKVLQQYLAGNKIEVVHYTFEHATNTWTRYFGVHPPFNVLEKRENRRKDIPDAWILEAALDVKKRQGRHCVLLRDGKLEGALKGEGFEVFDVDDVDRLDALIEAATTVVPMRTAAAAPAVALDRLRSRDFDNVDRIVLGLNEAWGTPDKETLFSRLDSLGIRRAIAEHEAKTLELSGVLTDTGSHLIPTNRETARQAENDDAVQALLLKVLDHEL